jgi:hypothetical protein
MHINPIEALLATLAVGIVVLFMLAVPVLFEPGLILLGVS